MPVVVITSSNERMSRLLDASRVNASKFGGVDEAITLLHAIPLDTTIA